MSCRSTGPHWTVAHGIEEVYQAIADTGLSSDHFEGPRYNRIAYLKQLLAEGRVGRGSALGRSDRLAPRRSDAAAAR